MDNQKLDELLRIPRFLNKPKKIIIFSTMEFYPICFFVLAAMFLNCLFYGLILSVGWFTLIRFIDQKFGKSFFLCTMFWYLPKAFSKSIFKATLTSTTTFLKA